MIFSRGEAQEPAGAYAGLAFVAVVVREQNGYGRMEHNRAEQQFEFFRSVFREPVGGWGLGGYGSHDAILDCLVDLETGDVEDAGHPFPQTLPRMAASHTAISLARSVQKRPRRIERWRIAATEHHLTKAVRHAVRLGIGLHCFQSKGKL
jgi:hypothetical protein